MARDHSRGSRPVVARAEGAGKTELTSGPGLSERNGRHAVLGERRTCGARVTVEEGARVARAGRLGWPAWELGRGAGLHGGRGKEELGWVSWVVEVGREREREQARLGWLLGYLVGLGPAGVFYFPFSILFPISNQTNTI